MRAITRRKLSMVEKVLAFEATDPATDASHVGVVAALQELYEQAGPLIAEEFSGKVDEKVATARRREIRRQLQKQFRHLALVAERAARVDTAVQGQFPVPQYNGPNRAFLATAEVLIGHLDQHVAVLLKAGLGETFVTEVKAGLAEFGAAGSSSTGGRLGHVDAGARLRNIAQECAEIVTVLDGLNASRFKATPERLTAWESARNVFGPVNGHGGPEAAPTGGPTPVTPITGEEDVA